jgi:hypothetical protein
VKLPRLRMMVLVGAIVGTLVPVVLLLLAHWTRSSLLVDRAMVFLWPTCVLLMATEGREHTFTGYSILTGVIARKCPFVRCRIHRHLVRRLGDSSLAKVTT